MEVPYPRKAPGNSPHIMGPPHPAITGFRLRLFNNIPEKTFCQEIRSALGKRSGYSKDNLPFLHINPVDPQIQFLAQPEGTVSMSAAQSHGFIVVLVIII